MCAEWGTGTCVIGFSCFKQASLEFQCLWILMFSASLFGISMSLDSHVLSKPLWNLNVFGFLCFEQASLEFECLRILMF
jgi:hypothetical protein